MKFSKDAKAIFVTGCRGSGKSTRIKEMIKGNNRIIAFDPMAEYDSSLGFTQYKTLKGLYAGLHKGWSNGFRLSLNALDLNDHEKKAVFLKLCADLLVIQRPYFDFDDDRELTFIIDEMSTCVPKTPKDSELQFKQLCNLGRHYGVEILGATQRVAEVPTNFRGNVAESYYMRQTNNVDIKAIGEMIGLDAARKCAKLKPHSYIHVVDGEKTLGKNKFL